MGQGKRRFFTPDFKAQAVKLVTEGKHPISQIAADLGIGESLLRRWRRDHEEQTAPASHSQAAMENRNSMEEELRRLRRENERLRQERDILKKRSRSSRRGRSEVSLD